ncbi:heteromeric transposase endonuclease subunit TnsA [Vibrio fluvialis]|uniref:heteromeric transposase endonuclease subunit TnsA n=1 Tax=Vibrio fluvialis TaxID=676 RepID=UPI001EEC5D8A|nr:heteromeric transposase endonuclease subunit TnsA [Vibrio fluvialis]EME3972279.1 heteromeric transposase endonuclease subunit TnsA [Vibrio fluvialis]MCG6346543.1 heteromeric transposase endonuclease subunit TnsA [Vibrio fluvialis]
MSVRTIPKNYRNLTGVITTQKSDSQVAFESSLERDLFIMLEQREDVHQYSEQPVKIEFKDENNQLRSYTPDALISFIDKPKHLVEVKYESELKENWCELKPKFKAATKLARSKGWVFKIYTEQRIRTPFLTNAKFLKQYRNLSAKQADVSTILSTLFELRESTPKALLATLQTNKWNQATYIPLIWHLVANNQIAADLNRPLTMNSPIWLPV